MLYIYIFPSTHSHNGIYIRGEARGMLRLKFTKAEKMTAAGRTSSLTLERSRVWKKTRKLFSNRADVRGHWSLRMVSMPCHWWAYTGKDEWTEFGSKYITRFTYTDTNTNKTLGRINLPLRQMSAARRGRSRRCPHISFW